MMNKLKEIIFPDKYVNQEAIDALTDITQNTYIIKASTGQGATTALLNHTTSNHIMVSPNVGMIEGKEKDKYERRIKYNSNKQLFIYGKSKDKWKDVEEYLDNTDIYKQNLILNTTPDQLWILWKNNQELYYRIIQIPIFVDEIHAYFEDSTLREDMGAVLELIYNDWNACFTLSTATPTYDFLDVPKDKDVKYYKLISEVAPKKEIQYTENSNHLEEFVYDQNAKGNPVAVFSNNLNVHKKFKDLRVLNMVGENLALKLAPFERGNTKGAFNYSDYDVIILSSRYFAGYDLELDCSICIVSQQANEAYKININNLVQAYGRCRGKVHDALYINATSKIDSNNNNIHVPSGIKEVNNSIQHFEGELVYYQSIVSRSTSYFEVIHHKCITQAIHVNRSKLFSPTRDKINDYHQYNRGVFDKALIGYNFEVFDYKSTNAEQKMHKSTKLNERLLNLLSIDEYEFKKDYTKIKYNIRHMKKGAFNSKIALEYLTALLLKKTQSEKLHNKLYNKSFSVKGFYKSFNLFLRANVDTSYYYEQLSQKELSNSNRLYRDETIIEILKNQTHLTNDWQVLYKIHQITNNQFSNEIERAMVKLIEANNFKLYKDYIGDKNHRVERVSEVISKRIKELSEYLNTQELEWLNEAVKDLFTSLDRGAKVYPVTKNSLKKKMVNYLIFILTNGKGYHHSKYIKNREYNAMVMLEKVFRKINPLIYIEIDLTAATPQLVDGILKTSIGLDVYSNLMMAKEVSRDKAKRIYNSTVNNHELSVNYAKSIYIASGYNPPQALKLAKMTAQIKKGSFYGLITKMEKRVIEKYQDVLSIKSFRHHDGIIFSKESIDDRHITIPTIMDGLVYHVEVFNDGGLYDGQTTNVPYDSNNTINNYYFL
jgi:hypothetical protein